MIRPRQLILNRFWTLAEGRAASGQFTSLVKPGNRIKTSEAKYLERLNSRSAPGDFPNVYARSTGGNSSTPQRTFGTGLPVAQFDHPVSRVVTLDVRAVFDAMDDDNAMPLEGEIDAILELLNEYVRSETLRGAPATPRLTRTDQLFAGQQRTVSTWNVTFECRPYRSTLIS